VQYIIHTAAPVGVVSDDYVRDAVNPSVNGTLNILRTAQDSGSVKRVVNMASAVAVLKWSTLMNPQTLGGPYSEKDIYEAPPPPYTHLWEAYWAAKAKTISETRAWIADVKPQFNVVNLLPTFVLGRNLRAIAPAEIFEGNTNGLLFGPLLGNVAPDPAAGTTVDVQDVARVCLESLTEKVKGHQDFLLSSDTPAGITWDDAIEIVKREFPEAVEKGIFPLGGSQPLIPGVKLDVSNAEQVFGKFKPFEEQVKTAVGQFVGLATKGSV
jgi:nucleoside-diphosphate-sugar epimerase